MRVLLNVSATRVGTSKFANAIAAMKRIATRTAISALKELTVTVCAGNVGILPTLEGQLHLKVDVKDHPIVLWKA